MRAKFPNNTFVGPKLGGNRLVVAEAPGAEEAAAGEPLVGGSGRLFDGLCSKAGVSRSSLTILNTIQCRPPNNVYPLAADARSYISQSDAAASVAQCFEKHVRPVLESRKWSRIDVLGDRALTAITGAHGIYNFRGFITESKHAPGVENVVPTIHPAALMRDQSMFPVVISDLKKSLVQPPEYYNEYPSLSDLEDFNYSTFAFDIENNRWTGEVYMVGLSGERFKALVVPFKGPYIAHLQRIFKAAKVVVGHNVIGHDIPHLEAQGIEFPAGLKVMDTMLMHHLVSPDLPHDLEFVASVYTNKKRWKHLAKANEELYCARDTDVTLQIYQQLLPLLKQFGLLELYENVQVPSARIAVALRALGVKVDPSQIDRLRTRLKADSGVLERQLPESLRTHNIPVRKRLPAPTGTIGKSGKPLKFITVESAKEVVPWRSDKEVGRWLYQDLGLPVQTQGKTGKVTTDKKAIDRLAKHAKPQDRAAITAVKKLRQLDETLTTFAKKEMTKLESIHTHFNVHGTSSGRLSSSEPNLQNIPEEARVIYVPHSSGWSILSADYSQIENRLTAYLARDTDRLGRFQDIGFSEHKWAASQFFGIPYDQVEKDNDKDAPYGKAKRIVHGANYGMGARRIAQDYDMDEKEVKLLLSKWKAAIFKTAQWQEFTASEAKRNGVLTNAFGRKRWFYTSSYFTESLSFLPQSLGADILLRSMLGLMFERVNWPVELTRKVVPVAIALPRPANLLLTVHDSLVFEVPDRMVDEVAEIVSTVMTQPWRELGGFSCPVSFESGPNWGEMSPLKLH
jgi:uracil-DNA glycosylase family 4